MVYATPYKIAYLEELFPNKRSLRMLSCFLNSCFEKYE